MTEKKDTTHILVPNSLVVFARPRSTVWQCRYQVDGKWQRESTNERNLDDAKRVAHNLLIEANVRKKLNAAPITRTFKDSDREAKLKQPTSFSRLFETYLKEHNLLVDPVTNKNRVLYSLRHTYATIALQIDNVEIHTLAVQMGTSVGMIEQHYSHLDAVKAVHKLRGTQSRQLIEAQGAIDKRFKWDEEKTKTPIKLSAKKKSK